MSISSKTYTPKAADIQRNWRVIDAANRPLGRLASEVAQILRGKDKPIFTPNLDTGDFVIVVNAAKIHVSSKKLQKKKYYSHSGYPGGFKTMSLEQMLSRHPRRVIEYAVWGMLPKGPLGRTLLRKLKVYAEETHPHGAQALEHARPETPGKPGRKPPKKVKARRAEPEIAVADETVVDAVAEPEAAAPADAPVSETVAEPAAPAQEEAEAPPRPRTRRARKPKATEEPVAEQAEEPAEDAPVDAGEVAEAVEAPKEAPEATEPLTPPPARPRSRRVRAQQERGTKPEQKTEAKEQGERPEQSPEQERD